MECRNIRGQANSLKDRLQDELLPSKQMSFVLKLDAHLKHVRVNKDNATKKDLQKLLAELKSGTLDFEEI
jgi:hypothetical protein